MANLRLPVPSDMGAKHVEFENVTVESIGVVPYNTMTGLGTATVGLKIAEKDTARLRRDLPLGWFLSDEDRWLYPVADTPDRDYFYYLKHNDVHMSNADCDFTMQSDVDPVLSFPANMSAKEKDFVVRQLQYAWDITVDVGARDLLRLHGRDVVTIDDDHQIFHYGEKWFSRVVNIDFERPTSPHIDDLRVGHRAERRRRWGGQNQVLRPAGPNPTKLPLRNRLLMAASPSELPFKQSRVRLEPDSFAMPGTFVTVPTKREIGEDGKMHIVERANLMVLGIKDDLTGYRSWNPEIGFAREKVWMAGNSQTKLSFGKSVASRVVIHRTIKHWRMLFMLRTRVPMNPGGVKTKPFWGEFLYLIPALVADEECSLGDRTFRGLRLDEQEAIWQVPKMSSALMHGLNSAKGQMLKSPRNPLGYMQPEALANLPKGHSFCMPHLGPMAWRGSTAKGKVYNIDTTEYVFEGVPQNTLCPAVQRVANGGRVRQLDL